MALLWRGHRIGYVPRDLPFDMSERLRVGERASGIITELQGADDDEEGWRVVRVRVVG